MRLRFFNVDLSQPEAQLSDYELKLLASGYSLDLFSTFLSRKHSGFAPVGKKIYSKIRKEHGL